MNLASLGDIRNCLLGGAFAAIASSSEHNRKHFSFHAIKQRNSELQKNFRPRALSVFLYNMQKFVRIYQETGGKEMPIVQLLLYKYTFKVSWIVNYYSKVKNTWNEVRLFWWIWILWSGIFHWHIIITLQQWQTEIFTWWLHSIQQRSNNNIN